MKEQSKKGLEILEKVRKDGVPIKCPKCDNENFYILGGFMDANGEIYAKPQLTAPISVTIIMCNECLCFTVCARDT